MSKLLRRIAKNGAALGVLVLLTRCGGSDLTLPSEARPAAISIINGDNQNGPAGAPLGDSLVVEVVDRRGEPVPGQRIAFLIADEVPGAAVTPAEATTDQLGLARAEWVLGGTPGTQSVIATVVGLEDLSVTFEAQVGSAPAQRLEYVSGDNQSVPVSTALPEPLVVRAADQFGNPVPGVVVEWEAESGTVDPASSTTGPDGQTSTSWVLGSSTGAQTARASSNGLTGSPISFIGTATAGEAARLILISGNNQSAAPGQELSEPLVVRLIDERGNGVPNRAVSWVVGAGGGSVSSPSSNTDGNGEAQVRWTLGTESGLNTLNAVVSGVGFVSFRATASTGGGGSGPVPSQLRFVVQPSDVEEDREFFPPVQVEVLDQNGSRMTEADIEIKLDLTGDDDGKLEGGDKERTRSGVAIFDKLKVDKDGEYRLQASAHGLPTIESTEFEVRERDEDD